MNNFKNKKARAYFIGGVISVLIISVLLIVLVGAVGWKGSMGTEYFGVEDDVPSAFWYNFSNETEELASPIFEINLNNEIISSNQLHENFSMEDFYWIYWNDTLTKSNSLTGILVVDSTHDNETGQFKFSIQIKDTDYLKTINITINASNDVPVFSNIYSTYNLTQDLEFYEFINASDEEEHYPLYFNISFFDNCTHASWSGRSAGENCSLFDFGFNLSQIVNSSASMNFTASSDEVGTYWANVSVWDFGEDYSCPHDYCEPDYEENKTASFLVEFNILASLSINASDCQDSILNEGEEFTCQINITTPNSASDINVWSNASVMSSGEDASNSSWFYAYDETNTANFSQTVYVNVTPSKTEIGNWSINFSVTDVGSGEDSFEIIYLYVNRTTNDVLRIENVSNLETSINLLTQINLSVYDDDLLIPDKSEGYNETINFTITIFNQSDLSQELLIEGFDVEILDMPVSGTNRTEAKIEFTPNETEIGNYTINISVDDLDGAKDFTIFNLSILSNNAPQWDWGVVDVFYIYEDNDTYLNFSQNVSDSDGDLLTFSWTNNTSFLSFNLNSSTGVVNFTPIDEDVGEHLVTVVVSDGYLTDSNIFNFTIYNINDLPIIRPLEITNATPLTLSSGSNMNATEDNFTRITMWIDDDDFKIPTEQKDFYNESISINLTIEGINSSLFNFSKSLGFPSTAYPNRTKYVAEFTPRKADVGSYNVTINVSDLSNASYFFNFTLEVQPISHKPVLSELSNKTSAVNRSFYYRINATDIEDGLSNESGNLNFTFSYSFLSGDEIFNSTTFNSTTGEVNIVFNDSLGGRYEINVSVNDSSGDEDSSIFWLDVYDIPSLDYPVVDDVFNLTENSSYNFTFQVNHSVGNNLSYYFYIGDDSSARYNLSYYGNSTNLTWEFTSNFSDESYGGYKNLTLVVYPFDLLLENRSLINNSFNFNLNISHENSPVSFDNNIGKQQSDYNSEIVIDLSNYFSDIDYSDAYYNQTVNFSLGSDTTPSYISGVFSGWNLTLSAQQSSAFTEFLQINASDLDDSNFSLTSALSNQIEIEFTVPSTTEVKVPSSGGISTRPISLKIIVPDPVSIYKNEKIIIPITLRNTGAKTLTGIDITGLVALNGVEDDDVEISFDNSYFSSLRSGAEENLSMTVFASPDAEGLFEITINADVKSPSYHDWGKFYLTVREVNKSDALEKIIFTEEFLASNPECIEIKELVDEARNYFDGGDYLKAIEKSREAIEACKISISQKALLRDSSGLFKFEVQDYVGITTLASFFIGILYYFYKRRKFRKLN